MLLVVEYETTTWGNYAKGQKIPKLSIKVHIVYCRTDIEFQIPAYSLISFHHSLELRSLKMYQIK